MTELDKFFDSLPDRLDFEHIYLAEHARCLELEAQLNALRDAARQALKETSWALTDGTASGWVMISLETVQKFQDELNKE